MSPTGLEARLALSTCIVNVTWSPPMTPALRYVLYVVDVINPQFNYVRETTGQQTYFLFPECLRGSTLTFSCQAHFPNNVASDISRPSASVLVPSAPPAPMSAPAVTPSPVDPSTMVTISWSPLVTPAQAGGAEILDVSINLRKASDGTGFVVVAPGNVLSYSVDGLIQV